MCPFVGHMRSGVSSWVNLWGGKSKCVAFEHGHCVISSFRLSMLPR